MVRWTLQMSFVFGLMSLALPALGQEPDANAAFPDVPVDHAGAPGSPPEGGAELPPQPARPEVTAPSAAPAQPWPAFAPAAPWQYAPPPVGESSRTDVESGERVWYGGQTLLVDGLSLGSLVLGGSQGSGDLALLGLGGYLFGAPIVHAAHGHAGKPFASLGMRVGLPLGGLFVGCAAEGDEGDLGCLGGAALGILLGSIAAITIDAAVIANEDAPERRPPGVGVVPSVAVTKERGSLGVLGWF